MSLLFSFKNNNNINHYEPSDNSFPEAVAMAVKVSAEVSSELAIKHAKEATSSSFADALSSSIFVIAIVYTV